MPSEDREQIIQQQPGVTVYAGPHPVIIKTFSPAAVRFRSPSRWPEILLYRKVHMAFGVIQMVIGFFCFLVDLTAVSLDTEYVRFGEGIYCGVVFFTAGLLGFIAGKRNNTRCVIACMVLSIIGICITLFGIFFAAVEIIQRYLNLQSKHKSFLYGKSIFLLSVCIFELIFSSVHSCLTCASCCYCCMPHVPVIDPEQVTTTTTPTLMHSSDLSPPQENVEQHPQQEETLPSDSIPQGDFSYRPEYTMADPSFSQPFEGIPPYNPAFIHDLSDGDPPPPYCEVSRPRLTFSVY